MSTMVSNTTSSIDEPLWTEKYQPNLDRLIQDKLKDRLVGAEGMNILLAGPEGCGKTVAARALADRQHENTENSLTEINVADFFNRSKKDIKNDPRFSPFLKGRSRMAKRDMINYVVKESTSYQTVGNSGYRTVLLDNAESIREDFQQSLRRTIERHHETTQFMLATRSPSSIIPAIKSRFLTIPVRRPSYDELESLLIEILENESVEYQELAIRKAIQHSGKDIRKTLMIAQATAEKKDILTKENVQEVISKTEKDSEIDELLEMVEECEYKDAKKKIDDLISSSSYSTSELIKKLSRRVEYNFSKSKAIEFQRLAGESEMNSTEGQRGDIHIMELLIRWSNNS